MISAHVHQFDLISKICTIVQFVLFSVLTTSIYRNSKLLSRYLEKNCLGTIILLITWNKCNSYYIYIFKKWNETAYVVTSVNCHNPVLYMCWYIYLEKLIIIPLQFCLWAILLHPAYLGLGLTSICRPAHDQTSVFLSIF